jgi:hypothetical protein
VPGRRDTTPHSAESSRLCSHQRHSRWNQGSGLCNVRLSVQHVPQVVRVLTATAKQPGQASNGRFPGKQRTEKRFAR